MFTIVTACGLASFTYWNLHNTNAYVDLGINIDSRFDATISKSDLHKASSIVDIVPKKADWENISFQSVLVSVLQGDDEIHESGELKELNQSQLGLLRSTEYSTDFYIKARGKEIHQSTGRIEDYVYYLTIIPEIEASYSKGNDQLINYLEENIKAHTSTIDQIELKSGRVRFTVNKSGSVENVLLDATSGYKKIDDLLMELIGDTPGEWIPASDLDGSKVDQELVLFYGRQGC